MGGVLWRLLPGLGSRVPSSGPRSTVRAPRPEGGLRCRWAAVAALTGDRWGRLAAASSCGPDLVATTG